MAEQEHQKNKQFDEAISIFKLNIEKQSDNAFTYVTLVRAYEENDMIQSAKDAPESL